MIINVTVLIQHISDRLFPKHSRIKMQTSTHSMIQDKRVSNMIGEEPVGKKYVYVKGERLSTCGPRYTEA